MKKRVWLIVTLVCVLLCATLLFAACDSKNKGNEVENNLESAGDNTTGGNSSGGNTTGGNTSGGNTSSDDPTGGDNTPTHTHAYTVKSTDGKYLASAATCKAAASYWYSCECGEKGTATFVSSSFGHHVIENNKCKYCGKKASEGLRFSTNGNGTCSVTDNGSCVDTDLLIPSVSPSGDRVTSIRQFAFRGCTFLVSINIPASVTSIGNSAFSGCSKLTSINIPASVTSIDNFAFGGCTALTSVTFATGSQLTSIGWSVFKDCTALASVTFAEGGQLTSIGDSAFEDCTSLTSINIPASVTSIGERAFYYCTALASVTFADGSQLTSIGNHAFRYCASLTSIEIPTSETSIGNYAFYECHKLIEICNHSARDIEMGVKDNGYVGYYAKNVYTATSGASKLMTTSDGYIFYIDGDTRYLMGKTDAHTQTTLTLPANCNGNTYEIYQYAFYRCNKLTGVAIPYSVTSIGSYAFSGCESLESAAIPYSLTSIGSSAFSGCSKLTSINIPASVTSIGSNAFNNCTALTGIIVDASNVSYKSVDGVLYTEDGKMLLCYPAGKAEISFTVPTGVTSIEGSAFASCYALTSIEIPASVTSIGNEAFWYCSKLTSINIPASVTSIGDGAFYLCTSLTSIEIPASVTSIGNSAFSGCYKLIQITDLSGKTLGELPSNLGQEIRTSVDTPFVNTLQTDAEGYVTYTVGKTVYFIGYVGNDTALDLSGKGITAIYQHALYNRKDITSIEIPASVTSIGELAFYNCKSLTNVTFAEGSQLTSIGDSAFEDCTALASVTFAEGSQLTSIGDSAFEDCTSLTSINIPASVTSIGNEAFYNCKSLTSVTFANPNGWWVSTSSSASSGTSVNVSDPATAATLLTGTYCYHYWKRS